jgi:recombination protein RecA
MDLEKLKKDIEKKAKGVHVSRLSESDIAVSGEFIKTPALDLNRILSGSLSKGIPVKGLICMAGPEHSFKSSLMVLSMVEAQRKGFFPVIFDTEGAITSEFCSRWGLDIDNCLYIYTSFIDDLFPILAQIKESEEEKFILGLDSIGGLELYKLVEDSIKGEAKVDPGNLAKWIRRLLKFILNICITKKSVGIFTAHIYSSPDIYTKDSIGGGNAVRLFPNIIVSLKKKEIIEGTGENKKVIGNKITATTLKNRFYPPFQSATIDIDFNEGINEYAGILDLCVKAGLITRSGGYYKHLNGDSIAHGQEAAEEALRTELPKLAEKLDEWLKTTGYSTVNKELERMVQISESIEKEEIIKTEEINTTEKPKKTRKKKDGQQMDATEES